MMARKALVDLAAVLALGLLALWLCWPLIFGGRAFYLNDFGMLAYPSFVWTHQHLLAGTGAAWDGNVQCGIPLLDSDFGTLLYPPARFLLAHLDGVLALGVFLAGHLFMAGAGAYALLRQRRFGAGPAFLGALVAAFSGSTIACLPAPTILVSVAYFPWMLLGLRLCQDLDPAPRWLGAAVLGLAVGYGFLGGYPGMGVYALLLLVLFHAVWMAERPRERAFAWGVWAALAVAALITALLYSGQAAAILRGAGQSLRGQALTPAQAGVAAASPSSLVGILLPHGLGRRVNDSFIGASWRFGTFEPVGLTLYLGLGPLILLLLALVTRPRQTWPMALAGCLLLFYAVGELNPWFRYLVKLPVLDHLRAPGKALCFFGVLAALPVAYGIEAAAAAGERRTQHAAVGLAVALALALACLGLGWHRLLEAGTRHVLAFSAADSLRQLSVQAYLARLPRILANLRWQLGAQAAWALAVGASFALGRRWRLGATGLALLVAPVVFGDLAMNARADWPLVERAYYSSTPKTVTWIQAHADPTQPMRTFSWGYRASLLRLFPQGRQAGDLAKELQLNEALLPNMQSLWGLDMANGYSPLEPWRMHPLLGWVWALDTDPDGAKFKHLRACRKALDLTSARWIVSSVPLDLAGLALRRDGDVRIYENLTALPMAYIASHSRGGYNSAGAWQALSTAGTPESRWRSPALLEDPSPDSAGSGTVRWISKADERWELQADVGSPQGLLVLSRLYYPGPWAAVVDGVGAPLLPVNAAFCALRLKQGRHTVTIRYDDPWLVRAWALQAAGLVLALGLLAWALAKRRRG